MAEAKPAAEGKTPRSPAPSRPPPGRRHSLLGGFFSGFFKIRDEPTALGRLFMGALCLGVLFVLWWWATRGSAESRIISPTTLGSPAET